MVRNVSFEAILNSEPGEVQLVEVLPGPEYRRMHLPNAESIPLKQLDRDAVAHLNPEKSVVVYCWDAY